MMKKYNEQPGQLWTTFLAVMGLIAIAIVSRIIPHPPNFTALGATGIFCGAWFGPRVSSRSLRIIGFIIPLTALLISDAMIGFHNVMVYTYFGTALMVILGGLMSPKADGVQWLGRSVVASTGFFLVTNFGVWVEGTTYPKTVSGLIECFGAGVPFFGHQILGDIFYLAIFLLIAGFAPAGSPVPALKK